MKKLIVIQHCQSERHLNGMVGGATDWPLTELGLAQAENVGVSLSKELQNEAGWILYSSDLTRARQTALIVGKRLGLTPVYREKLREQNLGEATGKSMEWFRANRTPCPQDASMIDHRWLPGAETIKEVYDRMADVVREITESENENNIVVGHGYALQALAAAWLKISVRMFEESSIKGSAGGVSFLSVSQDGKRVLNGWNDLSYREPR